jgi:hypothetical protein
MGQWIIFIIVGIVLVVGIEYLSRSFPPPWRAITLGVVVVILLLWLLALAGFIATPIPMGG